MRPALKRMTAFHRRLLIPVLAALGVTVALAVASGTPPPTPVQAAGPQGRPNVLVIESDDQTVESMRVMDNVNSLIGDQGATFQNSFVNFSLCCPSRATFLTGQYAHNHGVLGNKRPNGGFGRFESLHGRQQPGRLAAGRGLLHRHDRQVPERLLEQATGPAGLVGVARGGSQTTQDVYDYTLNENGTLVHYGQTPADFKQDVLTAQGGRLRRPPGAEPKPFFLWLTYTAPHVGGPNPNPNPPLELRADGEAGPSPRPCVRLRAAAEAPELQRGRRLRQAGRDAEPARC